MYFVSGSDCDLSVKSVTDPGNKNKISYNIPTYVTLFLNQ